MPNIYAAALIDRLVHHDTMISLKGKSYRLRERGLDVTPASTCHWCTFRLRNLTHFSAALDRRAESPRKPGWSFVRFGTPARAGRQPALAGK
jgi:hypothetical protein